jgi:hypothetical protein
MLNKGLHLADTLRVLDDILRRTQGASEQERAMLQPLRVSAMRQ